MIVQVHIHLAPIMRLCITHVMHKAVKDNRYRILMGRSILLLVPNLCLNMLPPIEVATLCFWIKIWFHLKCMGMWMRLTSVVITTYFMPKKIINLRDCTWDLCSVNMFPLLMDIPLAFRDQVRSLHFRSYIQGSGGAFIYSFHQATLSIIFTFLLVSKPTINLV